MYAGWNCRKKPHSKNIRAGNGEKTIIPFLAWKLLYVNADAKIFEKGALKSIAGNIIFYKKVYRL